MQIWKSCLEWYQRKWIASQDACCSVGVLAYVCKILQVIPSWSDVKAIEQGLTFVALRGSDWSPARRHQTGHPWMQAGKYTSGEDYRWSSFHSTCHSKNNRHRLSPWANTHISMHELFICLCAARLIFHAVEPEKWIRKHHEERNAGVPENGFA